MKILLNETVRLEVKNRKKYTKITQKFKIDSYR